MPQRIEIKTDITIDIATANSSKSLSWKNEKWQWADFVKKLSLTHYTAETHAEYMVAKKQRQDEIKNIGGFVGGYLVGGRRKAISVMQRQLISLDLDFATPDFWQDFILAYGCAAVVYSTHKHSNEAPRFRLIILLDRPVRPDEYQAITRRIAGILGIELFDPTTFQPERLMYWPSTSKGSEYFFEYQDGGPLSADDILAAYYDWKDSSSWPVSVKVESVVLRNIAKQGDPLEKTGIIGAFCRTYSIPEAIDTFLPDIYEACDTENRYTYKHGSTAAGLVVYDDKFSYSHHGTDPTSGKLCNAFDLVRVHKFGLQDEDKDYPKVTELPSFKAMQEFCTSDKKVVIQIGAERTESAFAAFAGEIEETSEEDENKDWLADLKIDKHGNYLSTIANICTVIENDARLKNTLFFDELAVRETAIRNMPWRKVFDDTKFITDKDVSNLKHFFEECYKMPYNKVEIALDVIFEKYKFHPVRDYLKGLSWDGIKRIDTLFIDYLGSENTDYIRAVTRKGLVAAVARIIKPGIKYDYVPTLVGKQGIGKSRLLRKLARHWFSDNFNFNMLHSKVGKESIQGFWIIEIAELAGAKKADVEMVKSFVASQEDTFRQAYGKRSGTYKRQCVFFGTTNDMNFLKDANGNRRFWPIDTDIQRATKSISELNDNTVNQVWAEAAHYYKLNEPLYLSEKLEAEALMLQEEHAEIDERVGLIQHFLETSKPVDNVFEEIKPEPKNRVCAAEIFCKVLGGDRRAMDSRNTRFIHNVMRKMEGWAEHKSRTSFADYGNQRGYYRIEKGKAGIAGGTRKAVEKILP